MTAKLLILDDDTAILQMLKAVFSGEEMEVMLESGSDSALKLIKTERPNVAIFDINMPDKCGFHVLQEAKKIDPRLSVIMTTRNRTTQNAIEAMKHGAYDYITKPFDIKKLKSAVHKALECNLVNRKVHYTKGTNHLAVEEHPDDVMIGSSPEMIEIWQDGGEGC